MAARSSQRTKVASATLRERKSKIQNGMTENSGFDCAQPTVRLRSTHRSTALNPPFDYVQPPFD
ncbi:MAG: hypothetical protein HC827_09435, partial [Cyanobacteria bacterium RM1_2_2]|nr:hypothetical protein [Cyanobacteria bacterium RM1_2_2]